MRRTEREMKARRDLEDVLRRAQVLHLGLVDGGEPYVVPLNFGYAGDRLYVHCALEGRKITALKRNPRVCFTAHVDYEVVPGKVGCRWSARYRSVIGYGRAVFVAERGEKVRALDAVLAKFAPGPFQYDEEVLARTAVIRIEIEGLTGKKAG